MGVSARPTIVVHSTSYCHFWAWQSAPIIAEAHGRHSETPRRVCWSPSQREEGVEALNGQRQRLFNTAKVTRGLCSIEQSIVEYGRPPNTRIGECVQRVLGFLGVNALVVTKEHKHSCNK